MKKYIAGVLVLATFIIGGQTAHASFLGDVWGGIKMVINGNHKNLGAAVRGAITTDTPINDTTTLTQDTLIPSESNTLPTKIPAINTSTKAVAPTTPEISTSPIKTSVSQPAVVAPTEDITNLILKTPVQNTKTFVDTSSSKTEKTPEQTNQTVTPVSVVVPPVALSKTEIKDIQNILKDQGFLTVKPNGKFGPKTTDAIKKFQEANGLDATGVVDTATSAALKGGSTPITEGLGGSIPTDPENGQLFKQCTIKSLTASPAVVNAGATSTISWSLYGCSYASIDGVSVALPAGSMTTSPLTATKTFKLIAIGGGLSNKTTKSVTVVVKTVPTITVTAPNGGESYVEGTQIPITWIAKDIPATARIGVVLNVYNTSNVQKGNQSLTNVASTAASQVTVTLPTIASLNQIPIFTSITYGKYFKVNVYAYDPVTNNIIATDESDGFFSINKAGPSLTILSPNGGEVFHYTDSFPYSYKLTYQPFGVHTLALYQNASTTNPGIVRMLGGGSGPNNNLNQIVTGNNGVFGNIQAVLPPGQYYVMVNFKDTANNIDLTDFSDTPITLVN